MSRIKEMTSASRWRNPLLARYITTSTSKAVRHTPHTSGRPNNKFNAIAEPITSARSHAQMATSHSNQSTTVTGRE